MSGKRLMTVPLLAIVIILIIGSGYILRNGINVNGFNIGNTPNNFQAVSIRIANTQRVPSSGTSYTLVLKNTSKHLIKQNSVYISYPIIQGESGQVMNKCKAEAVGNKIDIKPNEEVTLNVFIPSENYENNDKIDSNRPQYEVEGYLNNISNSTHFQQSGDFQK